MYEILAEALPELYLMVDPIAIREGMRLFESSSSTLPLTLLKCQTFSTGVLHLAYGPAESRPRGSYKHASKAMAEGARA